eukprot:Gb_40350 [translate_table: standard]
MELKRLIPESEVYKMNIGMPGPFWRDWMWKFDKPLRLYDSKRLYACLHHKISFSAVLNVRWASSDPENRWIHRWHSVWFVRLSYKLRVFAWMVIYQGLPTKARLAKSGFSDGQCMFCNKPEMVKHVLWERQVAKSCWGYIQAYCADLLHVRVYWQAVLLGDRRNLVPEAFRGIWHCWRIVALSTIWKMRCKAIFEQEEFSISVFCSMWRQESRQQLSPKGTLLIKDAHSLEPADYSDFIVALVKLRKRI